MDIVIAIYSQVTDEMKEIKKIIVVKYGLFMEILKGGIELNCHMAYDEWFQLVREYDTLVKSIPSGRNEDKSYLEVRDSIFLLPSYFKISPKVDSKKQRRVQCSINWKQLIDVIPYEEFEGGSLYGKTYSTQIRSTRRQRNGSTRQDDDDTDPIDNTTTLTWNT